MKKLGRKRGSARERVDKIIALSCLMMSHRQIAERCYCSESNVTKILAKRGYTPFISSGFNPRLQRYGVEKGRAWKGGRWKNNSYVVVQAPEHPRSDLHGYVLEHILVMERVLGRPIVRPEVVHHKNGNKEDNREENLEVLPSQSVHRKLHLQQREKR